MGLLFFVASEYAFCEFYVFQYIFMYFVILGINIVPVT